MNHRPLSSYTIHFVFLFLIILNGWFWTYSRNLQPRWGNVPPVMSTNGAVAMSLGDKQMGYRTIGLMLQNFGNSGGTSANLSLYNYERLGQWFFLATDLDEISNFVPSLAAFYFGATTKGEDLTPVINYLVAVGQQPQKQKWRWLAHAVYLARYVQKDLTLALKLAQLLADLPRDDMPLWARKMPIFVMTAKGEKEAAYEIMIETLSNGAKDLNPIEVRFLTDYTCASILTAAQAAQNPLCRGASK